MVSKYVKYAKTKDVRIVQNQSFCGNYLLLHILLHLRVALAKFREGSHDLEIGRGRYTKVPVNERFCKLCLTLNESHIEDNIMLFLNVHFMRISEKYIYISTMILLICILSSILCVLKIRKKLSN